MSVWGTGGPHHRVEAFLGTSGSPCCPPPRRGGVTITPRPRPPRGGGQAPGFAWGPGCALERAKPSGPPGYHCASPLLTRLPTSTEDPQTTRHGPTRRPKAPGRTPRPAAWVSTRTSARSVPDRYGNINPSSIDYACRPRLRSRLTQGGRTCPWNPWSLGAGDSHPGLATHACILAPAPSTRGSPPGFTQRRTLPYHPPPHPSRGGSAASAARLSPAELSAHDHSTSELLRTLSRMAASKPTSWLSPQPHILSHLAHA